MILHNIADAVGKTLSYPTVNKGRLSRVYLSSLFQESGLCSMLNSRTKCGLRSGAVVHLL